MSSDNDDDDDDSCPEVRDDDGIGEKLGNNVHMSDHINILLCQESMHNAM